jgi:hypothetical protein
VASRAVAKGGFVGISPADAEALEAAMTVHATPTSGAPQCGSEASAAGGRAGGGLSQRIAQLDTPARRPGPMSCLPVASSPFRMPRNRSAVRTVSPWLVYAATGDDASDGCFTAPLCRGRMISQALHMKPIG